MRNPFLRFPTTTPEVTTDQDDDTNIWRDVMLKLRTLAEEPSEPTTPPEKFEEVFAPQESAYLDEYTQHIRSMPEREPASFGRKLVAALAGAGAGLSHPLSGVKVAEMLVNMPYDEKMEDWKTKGEALSRALQGELSGLRSRVSQQRGLGSALSNLNTGATRTRGQNIGALGTIGNLALGEKRVEQGEERLEQGEEALEQGRERLGLSRQAQANLQKWRAERIDRIKAGDSKAARELAIAEIMHGYPSLFEAAYEMDEQGNLALRYMGDLDDEELEQAKGAARKIEELVKQKEAEILNRTRR